LKQGGTTVILPDHTPNVGGEYIPYFGVPLATSNLSAKLIQKTKARALFFMPCVMRMLALIFISKP
jgi:Lauroyl/myristoyl acyltransferase